MTAVSSGSRTRGYEFKGPQKALVMTTLKIFHFICLQMHVYLYLQRNVKRQKEDKIGRTSIKFATANDYILLYQISVKNKINK